MALGLWATQSIKGDRDAESSLLAVPRESFQIASERRSEEILFVDTGPKN